MTNRNMLKEVTRGIYVCNWKDCQDMRKAKYRDPYSKVQLPTVHLDEICGFNGTDERNRYYYITDVMSTAKEGRSILTILDDCESFIDQHRKEGVIFHCAAGASRSPTLAFLYLWRKGEIKRYKEFKDLYPEWFPNMGFESLFRELGCD